MAAGSGRRDPCRFRAGVRCLVPGWPQGYWGQRERGAVLGGTYLSAMVVGVFAWGTWPGLLLSALAVGVHAVSIADAIEQSAFPGFGWAVPRCAGMAMAAIGYAPLLWLALAMACPMGVGLGFRRTEGYLVNRWAYTGSRAPQGGDWVCYRRPHDGARCLGRLLAGSGQEVGWRAGEVSVDGRAIPWRSMPPLRQAKSGRLRVPEGLAWVESWEGAASVGRRLQDRMVPLAAIEGLAWVRPWPLWSPRLTSAAREAS